MARRSAMSTLPARWRASAAAAGTATAPWRAPSWEGASSPAAPRGGRLRRRYAERWAGPVLTEYEPQVLEGAHLRQTLSTHGRSGAASLVRPRADDEPARSCISPGGAGHHLDLRWRKTRQVVAFAGRFFAGFGAQRA